MFKNKKLVAIIPARGGSSGIAFKNIATLNKKPLIYYTIKAALNSKYLDSVYVSTDNSKIGDITRKMKIPVIQRPVKYSTDAAKSIEVVKHALRYMSHRNQNFDAAVLLQPTSPFRLGCDIDSCIDILFRQKLDSSLSVVRVRQHPDWMFKMDKGTNMITLLPFEKAFSRRQALSELFHPNGAVYAFTTNFIIKQRHYVCGGRCSAYVMDELRSIDIDTEHDLEISESIYPMFRKKYSDKL
jgi:CMP-N,N'-diacetyllegionaminic acid synthase